MDQLLSKLCIDWEKTLANDSNMLLAVDAKKAFKYKDGKRTDEMDGWNITIVVPRLQFEKLTVKVKTLTAEPPVKFEEEDISDPVSVRFIGLSGRPYISYASSSPQIKYSITAEGVEVLDDEE